MAMQYFFSSIKEKITHFLKYNSGIYAQHITKIFPVKTKK